MFRTAYYGKLFSLFLLILTLNFFANLTIGVAFSAEPKAKDLEKVISQAEKEYKTTQKKLNDTYRKIKEVKNTERDVTRQIERLNNAMLLAENRINITNLKKNKIHTRMNELTREIGTTTVHIDKVKGMLKERLVAIYKYGSVAEFNLFLSAPGAQDAMSTSYLLSRIAAEDQGLIEDLAEKKEKLNSVHTELARQKRELESQNKALIGQKNVLVRDQNSRNKLLGRVRSEKELFIAQQDELLRASRELQNTIKNMLEKKRQILAAQRNGQKEQVYYKGGRLAWPLRGKINSPFGGRIHPVFRTKSVHTGIDIDGNKGDPVRAANDGEVLYTGWLRGYGQVVILDHGGNLTTVYAHLSKIDAQESSKVSRGDLIGRVGSTGVSTGNHLHFEVRVNGNAVNPMSYL